jgi:hypothetical protein
MKLRITSESFVSLFPSLVSFLFLSPISYISILIPFLLFSHPSSQVVFFAKTSELHILNKAIIYARDNELCDRIIICHVHLPQIILPPTFCNSLPSITYSHTSTCNLSPTSTPLSQQTPPLSARKNIPRELFLPSSAHASQSLNVLCDSLDDLDSLQHFCCPQEDSVS